MAKKSGMQNKERAHYDEVRRLGERRQRLQWEFEAKKEELKFVRDQLKHCETVLFATINGKPDEQLKLPGCEESPEIEFGSGPRWRVLPIAVAIHDLELQKALIAEGVSTMGDLADRIEDESAGSLAGNADIGEIGEAKILDALKMFWESQDIPDDDPPDGKSAGAGK